jgi:hypothetical protein
MRYQITAVVALGGMLALGACEPRAEAPSAANASQTAAPSSAQSPEPSSGSGGAADPAPLATPHIQRRTVTATRAIAFATRRVSDPALAKGTTRLRAGGRTGLRRLTYLVTLTDGVQTGKRLVRAVVLRAPVTRVVAVGTKQTRQCDPNYSGACVPIASDVDCAGGSGNGPAYVQGPVRVVGDDHYGLDRDGDGTACD